MRTQARGRHALTRVVVAALGAIVSSCAGGKHEPPPRPPAQVVAAPAQVRAVPVEVRAIGTVVPISTIAVRSHVSGTLDRVYFREGAEVREGQLLFQIDPRGFRAALAQARAALARDRAQFLNAQVDLERYRKLLPNGIVAESDYDSRKAQVSVLQATINADRAAIRSATVNLDYTTIRSPITGRTGNLQITEGNLVKADDTTSLVTIRQLRPIDVAFSIAAGSLDEVRRRSAEGPLAVVATPDRSSEAEHGKLVFIDNTVDPATGTVLLKGRFPNEDTGLWPGEYVEVRLVLRTMPDAVVVQSRAIQPSQSGRQLFVVKNGVVELRQVATGPRLDDSIVVTKGVAPREQVVVDGILGLVPGEKVIIRGSQQEQAPKSAQTPLGEQATNSPQPAPGLAPASDGQRPHAQGRRP